MLPWLMTGGFPVLNLLCSDENSRKIFARSECDCDRMTGMLKN